MLKDYHIKRPIYKIWRYDGGELLPPDVLSSLWKLCSEVKVITSQGPSPYRYVEASRKWGGKTLEVHEGDYIVFDINNSTVEVRRSILEFEEAS